MVKASRKHTMSGVRDGGDTAMIMTSTSAGGSTELEGYKDDDATFPSPMGAGRHFFASRRPSEMFNDSVAMMIYELV